MSRPRKIKPSAANPARVTDSIRFAPNPLPQLTPANLAAYLDSFARGYLRDTALLWNAIQWRDDRVGSDSAKRHKTTPRYGYSIVPAEGQDPDDAVVQRHVDAIKFALDNLTARDVLDESVRGGVSMLARQMMRAVGMQWQVHELVWKPLPGGLTLDAIAMPLWWFERTTGALRYLPSDLAIEGAPLEPEGWMVARGDGIMGATSLLYLLKRMALTDWTLYNGRVGPGIHGQTSAAPESSEWRDLEDAVENFGFDLKIVTQDNVKINPIDCALKGTLPWPEMYQAMVKAITVLWRGGNLMSDSGGQPDQAGVTLQGAESSVLEQDDAEMLSDALNDYIVAPLLRYRFDEDPLAWVEWKTSQKPDRKAEIEIDRFLGERGWQFTVEDLAERYARTPPQEGQTVLAPPAPAATFPPQIRAANAKDIARDSLVAAGVAQTVSARAAVLAPWIAKFADLSAKSDLSESAFLDALEALVRSMPAELLTRDNISALAAPLEGTLGAAFVNALAAMAEAGSRNTERGTENA